MSDDKQPAPASDTVEDLEVDEDAAEQIVGGVAGGGGGGDEDDDLNELEVQR